MARVPTPPPASPPHASPPDTTATYRTQSTSLSAALIAAGQLVYLRAELSEKSRDAVFVFDDPLAQGDELQRRFNAGLFPRVEPKALFSARGFLMDEMARIQGGGRHARKAL